MLPRMVFCALLAAAPFQCPSDPDPQKAREETPAEALYTLALAFRSEQNPQGELRTLRFLVARYPNSRFAEQARQDLAAAQHLGSRSPSSSASGSAVP